MKVSEQARYVRLLLVLCELQAAGDVIKKGDLSKKTCRKGEKFGEYQTFLGDLIGKGAIAEVKKGRSVVYEPSGAKLKSLLADAVRDPEFAFDGSLTAGKVNVLLDLLREVPASVPATQAKPTNGKEQPRISSYEEFKTEALQVFDRLNRDFNMDNLVPIYRIRREIGDRVERSQFSDWMLELQANDILQLVEGSVEDSALDKIEDSITTKLGKLRCYAKRTIA